MKDGLYKRFVCRWEEVTELPPQTLGPLTPYYKSVVRRLKTMPWPMFLLTGLVVTVCLYFLLGSTIIFLVSLLQRGF